MMADREIEMALQSLRKRWDAKAARLSKDDKNDLANQVIFLLELIDHVINTAVEKPSLATN